MVLDKFYIDGEWVPPVKDEKIDIINPSDESVIGTLNVGSQQDIDNAVKAAKTAFSSYARTSVAERLDLLKEIRSQFENRFEDFVEAITKEMGAPAKLSRSAQAAVGMNHLKTAIRVLEEHKFEYPFNGYTVRH